MLVITEASDEEWANIAFGWWWPVGLGLGRSLTPTSGRSFWKLKKVEKKLFLLFFFNYFFLIFLNKIVVFRFTHLLIEVKNIINYSIIDISSCNNFPISRTYRRFRRFEVLLTDCCAWVIFENWKKWKKNFFYYFF